MAWILKDTFISLITLGIPGVLEAPCQEWRKNQISNSYYKSQSYYGERLIIFLRLRKWQRFPFSSTVQHCSQCNKAKKINGIRIIKRCNFIIITWCPTWKISQRIYKKTPCRTERLQDTRSIYRNLLYYFTLMVNI